MVESCVDGRLSKQGEMVESCVDGRLSKHHVLQAEHKLKTEEWCSKTRFQGNWEEAVECKSMERGGNLTPSPSKTPEPMITKLGMGDDVGDSYACTKFHYDLIGVFSHPPLHAHGIQSDSASFLGISGNTLPASHLHWLLRSVRQMTFRTMIWLSGDLTMAMLPCKLPLIVIVAQKSCIVNKQIGVGESKYGVTSNPLFTGCEGVMWPTFRISQPIRILGTV